MESRARAERFMRGLYSGDSAVVDEHAADDIVISYPIFKTIYGTPALRGREAARQLAASFSRNWADPALMVHESVAEGNRVVLVWSFSARDVGTPDGTAADGRVHTWGGISVFHFDEHGRISAEIGEESEPGPASRVAPSDFRP